MGIGQHFVIHFNSRTFKSFILPNYEIFFQLSILWIHKLLSERGSFRKEAVAHGMLLWGWTSTVPLWFRRGMRLIRVLLWQSIQEMPSIYCIIKYYALIVAIIGIFIVTQVSMATHISYPWFIIHHNKPNKQNA